MRIDGKLSRDICICRGLRQGDPLSPVLFNAVIDLALKQLDSNIGVRVGNDTLSCMAFADDLVILSNTPKGLQSQFALIENALGTCGLTSNAGKCATIRTDVDRKSKIWCCNPNYFLVSRNGNLVKALNIIEGYQYLGNTVKVGRASETPLMH